MIVQLNRKTMTSGGAPVTDEAPVEMRVLQRVIRARIRGVMTQGENGISLALEDARGEMIFLSADAVQVRCDSPACEEVHTTLALNVTTKLEDPEREALRRAWGESNRARGGANDGE